MSRYRGNRFMAASALVAGISAEVLLSGCSSRFYNDSNYVFPRELVEEVAAEDGFDVVTPDSWGDTYRPSVDDDARGHAMRVSVDLGSCTLRYLDATYEVDDKGQLVDITGYSFDGHVLARDVNSGVRGNTSGQPITFEFANLRELKSKILGDEPCKTLANADMIQG